MVNPSVQKWIMVAFGIFSLCFIVFLLMHHQLVAFGNLIKESIQYCPHYSYPIIVIVFVLLSKFYFKMLVIAFNWNTICNLISQIEYDIPIRLMIITIVYLLLVTALQKRKKE